MLRTLLADRFGLRAHQESREMDGYALVLASGTRRAPGMYPVNVDCDATAAPQPGEQVGLFLPEKRPACGASIMTMPLASGPILRIRRHSAITMDAFARGVPMASAEAHPETAQMMIMNPLSGGGLAGLFRTHPPTEERVARLRALA